MHLTTFQLAVRFTFGSKGDWDVPRDVCHLQGLNRSIVAAVIFVTGMHGGLKKSYSLLWGLYDYLCSAVSIGPVQCNENGDSLQERN